MLTIRIEYQEFIELSQKGKLLLNYTTYKYLKEGSLLSVFASHSDGRYQYDYSCICVVSEVNIIDGYDPANEYLGNFILTAVDFANELKV